MQGHIHPLQSWFDIVIAALKREDLFLRRYLQPFDEGAYSEWHPGIICLYETGLVYLILRELWITDYPHALSWEYAYPNWNGAKLDIAVFAQRTDERVVGCPPAHAIEVKKKWIGKDSKQQCSVWWDMLKLLWFDGAEHRYVLLLTFGPSGSNLKQDVDDILEMRIGRSREPLGFSQLVDAVITRPEDRDFYRDHYVGVSESLASEFDTKLGGQLELGHVRVSLIEVNRK